MTSNEQLNSPKAYDEKKMSNNLGRIMNVNNSYMYTPFAQNVFSTVVPYFEGNHFRTIGQFMVKLHVIK